SNSYKHDRNRRMNPRGTRPAVSDARLRQLVLDLAGSPQRWLHLVEYDPARRWYQRLLREDDREVWLLSWLPGQRTGFHDHGRSSGAFAVARGVLRERTAPGRRPGRSAAVSQGEVKSFGPWYIRDVINASVQPAVSVHVYSPPLTSMRRFEFGPGGLERVTMETAVRW